MSQARDIYTLIQKIRDETMKRWRDMGIERYPLKCERDKMCEELQQKIAEMFSDEFPHLRKGAK